MYNFTDTFVYKDLFDDFDNFCEIRDQYLVGAIESSNDEQQLVYNILYNNFCNSSIAYDTPDAFFRLFFIEYWNCCDEFTKRLQMIKTIRNMSLDEIKVELKSISNVASNDNSPVTNPLAEIIPYITTQSSSVSSGNTAIAINRAIELYRDNEVNNFVNKFRKFFLAIHPDFGIIYSGG